MDSSQFEVRLARDEGEIMAAQRLRYQVFVKEMGATTDAESAALGLERDAYDPYFDHLLLIDRVVDRVVGVYRVMRSDMAAAGIGFYGATEYDLGKLESHRALELGRSCVAREYRSGVGIHLLWEGLGAYVSQHEIEVLFGVASFHGTDPQALSGALSYLHHSFLAPEDLRVRSKVYQQMDMIAADQLDSRAALRQIPSLIKAYLRLGGFVGDGAFIDKRFNTIDVCLLMDTGRMVQKYREFYSKKRG
ncbi:MAG: GNAT family N-acetyltransferase [Rhodobacteraceae bacterium]|nr:GNAT family N-acetyltransferase [Paracoccaceae bacterium]